MARITHGKTHSEVSAAQFEAELLTDPEVKFGFDNYAMLKEIGAFLRSMRKDVNLSQEGLGSASGVDQAEISRLERDEMERDLRS